jgi:TatD DNase family protein
LFDSHCHLDDAPYDKDRSAVLARAEAAGVLGILVPGFEPAEWQGLRALCATSPRLRCAVGLHPWYIQSLSPSARETALAGLEASVRIQGAVAVGECGLDKKHAQRGGAPMELQVDVLRVHLALARKLHLPVVLHCVDAHGALLEVLAADGPLAEGGVLHSYSGAADLVPRYVAMGLSFSFAGVLTRARAQRPKRSLLAVPLARLLVESDGPDQAAESIHPGRSEPAHVALVLDAMAAIRPESRSALAEATTGNALRLFDGGPAHKHAHAP